MGYLIGIIVVVLVGFFVYANMKHKKHSNNAGKGDEPAFRTEEDLSTYNKPLDDKQSRVDFDDAE